MKLYEKYKTLFAKFGLNTPLRISHFMAQIEHESGLNPINENLNYSATRLMQVFPKYFISNADALHYERKPEKIANRVYANRMGNSSEASGDGYKFRGRGFIQLTGKGNYNAFKNDSGIDVINNPDLLLEEQNAIVCAIWFWNNKGLNIWADKDDTIAITKKINGGVNGLDHRKQLLSKYKKELS